MRVGVTMRTSNASGYQEQRDAISHDLSRMILDLGGVPIPIPNTASDPGMIVDVIAAERICLTGGDDLGGFADPDGSEERTIRDSTEIAVLRRALDNGIPVIGICRGLQLINTFFGGGITRNLAAAVPGETHRGTPHPVTLADGRSIVVNSFHNDGVLEEQIAPGLQIFARSSSGVVEGVRHVSLPVLAVQWHPERDNPEAASFDADLLREWLG